MTLSSPISAPRRIAAIAAIAFMLATTACSSAPTKAEFIDKVTTATLKDAKKSFDSAGLSTAESKKVIAIYAGCAYDELAKDSDKLQQAFDTENGMAAAVESSAPKCSAKMSEALNEAMQKAAAK